MQTINKVSYIVGNKICILFHKGEIRWSPYVFDLLFLRAGRRMHFSP